MSLWGRRRKIDEMMEWGMGMRKRREERKNEIENEKIKIRDWGKGVLPFKRQILRHRKNSDFF